MIMTAEILCVGTELLLGSIINTNAAFLSRELASLGIFVYHQSVVGDNQERLKSSIELSLSRADILIITGGLGPTYDDLTKETAAAYFKRKMVMHEPSLERLKQFFGNLNRTMTPNNAKQAMMPEGAVVFPNNYGTAPALAIESEIKGKTVIMLPGPPREIEPIFTEEVKPYLQKKSGSVLVSKSINLFGTGESAIEHNLREVMQNAVNPSIAPYAKEGEVEIRVTASGANERECLDLIEPAVVQIKSHEGVGEFIYGIDVKSLQNAVYLKLREKNLTLATAESCTGGLISKRITEIPGSSSVYLGGVVAYDNSVKINMLGVSPDTLKAHGAVSEQTAAEMARGAAQRLGADIGVATTGIAGPGGGTDEKPVGLVCIGVYYKNNTRAVKLNLSRRLYKDEREMIRYIASSHALREVLNQLSPP